MIDASGAPSTSGHNRGFDVKRRPRWPWFLGGFVVLAAVAAVLLSLALQPATGAADEHFGSDLKVAYLSTDASQEAFLEFVAAEVAPDYDITIEPVGIGDPNTLHEAVSNGEIAATVYAHEPWIRQSNEANGWTLEPTIPVFQWAYSLWSSKYASFDELPDGANIALLDDPANTAQALLLLANDGVIGLDDAVDPATASLDDIVENPRGFTFTPIAFGTAARTLDDFDGIVSYNFEFVAAGTPEENKIYAPQAPLVFAAQLAVSEPYLEESNIRKLVDAFGDPRVRQFLETTDEPAVVGQLAPVSDK